MLRHEDRLYHIVVSFPSVCARQFFIFKFRRNEAIYCLIGFGIGIGCCLVYKWFRTTLLTFSYIDTKPFVASQNNTLNKKNNENGLLLVNNDKKRIRSSFSESVFKRKKSPKTKRVNRASNLNVKINFSQGFGFNLIKYLNRLSFKNSKRPLCRLKQFQINKKKRNIFQKGDLASPIRDDFLSLDPASSFDSKKNVDKTDKDNDLEKKLLSFDYKNTLDNLNRNGKINNSIIDFSNYFAIKEENKNSIFFGDDDDLFDIQTNLTKQNFNFDIDNLSDTKLGASKKKSQNSVDKSLDEALEHIDRLKKDMNHLCSDLDLLYNSKKDVNESTNDSYQSNASINSSYSNLNFEFDDDLIEDFSSLNENCRLKTPFRELNVPKSVNIFSAEKSTQTSGSGPKVLTIKSMKRKSNRKMNKIYRNSNQF